MEFARCWKHKQNKTVTIELQLHRVKTRGCSNSHSESDVNIVVRIWSKIIPWFWKFLIVVVRRVDRVVYRNVRKRWSTLIIHDFRCCRHERNIKITNVTPTIGWQLPLLGIVTHGSRDSGTIVIQFHATTSLTRRTTCFDHFDATVESDSLPFVTKQPACVIGTWGITTWFNASRRSNRRYKCFTSRRL